jgi:GNAT superfamily N-acetyltransferase
MRIEIATAEVLKDWLELRQALWSWPEPEHRAEGIYVKEPNRRQDVARALIEAVEKWTRGRGCSELASDAWIDNANSHRMHAALGFSETERVVYFRKNLD